MFQILLPLGLVYAEVGESPGAVRLLSVRQGEIVLCSPQGEPVRGL